MSELSVEEAARRLGVKVETVYAYVSRGVLRSHRRPGSRASWFDARDVEAVARRGRPRRTTRPAAIDFTVETRITAIRDQHLLYRGIDATRLASDVTFEQVAELLWTGLLPSEAPSWPSVAVAPFAGPTAVDHIRHAVVAAAAADPLAGDLRPGAVTARGRRVIAAMVDALPVAGDGRTPRLELPAAPTPLRSTIAGRLWARLAPRRPRPGMLRALNAALVLLADHELAASTVAARVAASARADPYAVVLSGLGPVSGPLHGRASRYARDLVAGTLASGAGAALAHALGLHGAYPGFGHFLYPDGDPRARLLFDLLRAAVGGTAVFAAAEEVVDLVRRRAAIEPNVDFALGVLAAAASMTPDAGEAIFTIARTAGWVAHALEEYGEAPLRFRARAVPVA